MQRLGARGLLLAPLLWVAGEFARGHVLGGFPWIPLGSAVVTILPVAQLASLVGVYGVSFFLVLQGVLVARAITGRGRDRWRFAAAAAVLLIAVSVWGSRRVADAPLTRAGRPVVVGLIQANIAQVDKWNPAMAGEIARRYSVLTRESAAAGADVILWPESSTPYLFNEDRVSAEAVRELVRSTGVPLLFGTDEIERGPRDRYFNSAMMLDQTGAVAAVYRKIQLVPFGEYVPLRQVLFFVQPLVDAVSDFTPGERVTMLPVGEHMASTAICYEVVYPHLMRQAVLEGAELLTTITNDAWYGDSSAPYQHFELASMRAIEQGRYLARAANTGISGVIDPYGRVVAKTRVFEEAVVNAEARFLQSRTLYARIGDLGRPGLPARGPGHGRVAGSGRSPRAIGPAKEFDGGAITGRPGSAFGGSAQAGPRPAELSLTGPRAQTNWPSSNPASPRPTSGRTRPKRRRPCSAAAA